MLYRENCYLLFLLTCLFACPLAANAQVDKAELAKKAQAILKTNCYQCHGNGGSNKGGFNYVLVQPRLLAAKKVVPGDLKASKLYKYMADEYMPPETDEDDGKPVKQRPSKEDIAVIKQWIEASAPDFDPVAPQREFISPAKILELMRDDLKEINPRDRKFIRYFTLTHLYNAGFSDDEMQTYRNALSKLVNSLSWGRDIVVPKAIDPAKSILRINLTDYDWDEKTWDLILAGNPYGITYATPAARECYRSTECKLPHVRGDWFLHAAARPPLYHTILKLPKTDRELEKELRIDVAENIRKELVRRAGFNGSGVSQNNRLLEWHKTGYGAYWKSYDFAGKVDRKNLFQHPLGPVGTAKDAFEQDGGEIIFNLPNKLQAYLLIDGKGNRIDVGPLKVVSDPKQKDRAVVNGISCMSCHAKGMIEKTDQVRSAALGAKNSYTEEELTTIQRLYPEKKDFDKLLHDAAEDFKTAVEATGTKLTASEPIVALSLRFEDELDLKLTAAEIGVTPEEFHKGLARAPAAVNRAFSTLRLDGGTVQRDVLVKEFGEMVRVLNLGQFHATEGSSGERKPGEVVEVEIASGVKMKFCWIPPGEAQLGSPKSERQEVLKLRADKKEMEWLQSEAEEVRGRYNSKGFWLAKYAVTQGEWTAVMDGKNPSHFVPSQEDVKRAGIADTNRFPVEQVSWNDCQELIKKLNASMKIPSVLGTGKFCLPHEDEWEYAARGARGNKQPFYFGNVLNGKQANGNGNFPYGTATKGPYLKRTTAVGSYENAAPHPWGLCDMVGNVEQWCENKYDDKSNKYVVRGGAWAFTFPGICRSASRVLYYEPDFRIPVIGCRICFRLD